PRSFSCPSGHGPAGSTGPFPRRGTFPARAGYTGQNRYGGIPMAYLDPIAPDAWSPRLARHLLNRAGFGVPYERVAALAAQSPAEAVDTLVAYHAHPRPLTDPDFLLEPLGNGEIRKM